MTEKLSRISFKEIIFLLMLVVFGVCLRMQSLSLPLDRDEGTIAYMAKNMSHTEAPYRDIFDFRPPLIYSVYRAAFSIFGTDTAAIRYFTILSQIFIILLLYMFARSVSSSAFLAMLSALFYVIYVNNYMMQGLGSYPDIFVQFPVLASMLFTVDTEKDYEHVGFFLSGFFAATALALDTNAIFFILAPVAYIIFYGGSKRKTKFLWCFGGFITVVLLTFGWAIYRGILKEFINSVMIFGAFFAVNSVRGQAGSIIKLGASMFASQNIVPLAGIVYVGVKTFRKKSDQYSALLLFAFITLFGGIMLFRGLYPHYYLILTPVIALAGADMLRDMFLWLKKGKISVIIAALVIAASVSAVILFQIVIMKAPEYLKNGKYTVEYYYDLQDAVKLINSRSGDMSRGANFLFAWPNMPDLYFNLNAKAATKYIYSYPLGFFTNDRNSVTSVLFNQKPVWVVLEKGTYQAFQGYLDNYYRLEMDTSYIAVYRNLLK